MFLSDVIVQKHGLPIEAREDCIDAAIVIEIADGEAAGAITRVEYRASLVPHVAENTVPVIAEKERRLFVLHVPARGLNHLVDVPIHNQQIQISVVIVIDKVRSPTDIRFCIRRQPRGHALVSVQEGRTADEQRVIFVVEIRNCEVGLTVSVDIPSVDSHTRLRHTVGVIGHLGVDCGIYKRAISFVEQKQIRRGIAGHEEIGPVIIIHIDTDHPEGAADQCREPAFRAHVGERTVAVVVIKGQRHSRVSLLLTVSAPAVEFALLDVVERKVGIVRYDEIQISVAVKIKPRRTCRPPPGIPNLCAIGDVREGSVTIVMEEGAYRETGYVQIREAIVVKICHSNPHSIELEAINSGLCRDVFEFPISDIPIKGVANRKRTLPARRFAAVNKKEILKTVTIEVQKRHTTPHRFNQKAVW